MNGFYASVKKGNLIDNSTPEKVGGRGEGGVIDREASGSFTEEG